MTPPYVLSIDQGTTSTRAVVYDGRGVALGSAGQEITQHYPKPGWVEHDPEEIWTSVAGVVPKALAAAKVAAKDLTAIGITNQRETSLIWERISGRPIYNALVWQDRRTTDFCRLHQKSESWLHHETGLLLDPYFTATKIRWVLDQQSDWRLRAEAGQLASGTVDSFLIWRLTGGKVHATDVTNASRTLLMNLTTGQWSDDLCRFFAVPQPLLARILASADDYGVTTGLDFLPDGIPITGVAGDQQAALFGQCAFSPGQAKCTYGTGAFYLLHTGAHPVLSRQRLLTTWAATLDNRPQYALEGSIFIAGAAVQWLRDGLKLINTSSDVENLAARSDPQQPVVFIPALVGLGAPHWVPEARGAILGLTRSTSAADLGRAALEGVAYQVADLLEASSKDSGQPLQTLRVDGGMARNAWFLQCQADLAGIPVLQSSQAESTALGAAFLAGLKTKVWPDVEHLRTLVKEARRFIPRLPDGDRQQKLARWRNAIKAIIDFHKQDSAPTMLGMGSE